MAEERFIAIETKLAHQEYALEQLNQVVYEQQKTIDKLENHLKKLAQKFQDSLGEDESEIRGNEKPPHY
ncbi:MAG: SlyX family protein [Bdellovibrio sp.]